MSPLTMNRPTISLMSFLMDSMLDCWFFRMLYPRYSGIITFACVTSSYPHHFPKEPGATEGAENVLAVGVEVDDRELPVFCRRLLDSNVGNRDAVNQVVYVCTVLDLLVPQEFLLASSRLDEKYLQDCTEAG